MLVLLVCFVVSYFGPPAIAAAMIHNNPRLSRWYRENPLYNPMIVAAALGLARAALGSYLLTQSREGEIPSFLLWMPFLLETALISSGTLATISLAIWAVFFGFVFSLGVLWIAGASASNREER